VLVVGITRPGWLARTGQLDAWVAIASANVYVP